MQTLSLRTSTGLRRMMMNCSERCMRKRVNLWHKIRSTSSACLIAMLTRTELIEVSIKHFLLLRAADRDRVQLELFASPGTRRETPTVRRCYRAIPSQRRAHGGGRRAPISTSGLLCRSTSCDGKFRRHSEAVSVLLTQSKYGL